MNQDQFVSEIAKLDRWKVWYTTTQDFMNQHRDFLISLKCEVVGGTEALYFNAPSREEVLEIIKYFAGKWQKDDCQGSLTYRLHIPNSEMDLTIQGAPLLPTCRVVEVEEIYPAQTVKIRKIVCSEEGENNTLQNGTL